MQRPLADAAKRYLIISGPSPVGVNWDRREVAVQVPAYSRHQPSEQCPIAWIAIKSDLDSFVFAMCTDMRSLCCSRVVAKFDVVVAGICHDAFQF